MQFSTAFPDINGSKYMSVHSLASKYARFVVLGRLIYWTPPPPRSDHWTPPFQNLMTFLGNQEILDPPFKNPGHAPVFYEIQTFSLFYIRAM